MDVRNLAVIPTRPLLALTLAVLLLHAALLQFAPIRFSYDEPMTARRLIARGVLLAAPMPPMAPSPAANAANSSPKAAGEETARARPNQAASPPMVKPDAPVRPAEQDVSAPALAASAPGQRAAQPLETGPSIQAQSIAAATNIDTMQKPANVQIPGSVRLKFRVSAENRGVALNTSAELLWQHDGRSYEARFSVGNLLRTRVQTSRGAIGGQGLMPTRFSDKTGSERAAHFERGADGQAGQVVFSANSPVASLAPGAQDRLSVLVQLGAMLAGEPSRLAPGSEVSLQVVGAREAAIWVFKIEGDEALDLPQGPVQAVKLTRYPRHEHEQKVELWLAQAMGYLPARIRVTEPNGNFLDQKLEKLETP